MMRANYQSNASTALSGLDAILKKNRLRDQANNKKITSKIPSFFDDEQSTESNYLVSAQQAPVKQHVESITWNPDDQILINSALNCFERYPAMRVGGARLLKEIKDGANSIRAQTGELQNHLRWMIHLIELDESRVAHELTAR